MNLAERKVIQQLLDEVLVLGGTKTEVAKFVLKNHKNFSPVLISLISISLMADSSEAFYDLLDTIKKDFL